MITLIDGRDLNAVGKPRGQHGLGAVAPRLAELRAAAGITDTQAAEILKLAGRASAEEEGRA